MNSFLRFQKKPVARSIELGDESPGQPRSEKSADPDFKLRQFATQPQSVVETQTSMTSPRVPILANGYPCCFHGMTHRMIGLRHEDGLLRKAPPP